MFLNILVKDKEFQWNDWSFMVWFLFLFVPGLLHVGDIIKEINDVDITNDPEAFHQHLAQSNGRVTLKILPSYFDMLPPPPPVSSDSFLFILIYFSFVRYLY